jgi:hypothetical protein
MFTANSRSQETIDRYAMKTRQKKMQLLRLQVGSDLVHGPGELDVERGQAQFVIGIQGNVDRVVQVAPVGVVLICFGYLSGLGYEEESGSEVRKNEAALDAVPKLCVLHQSPERYPLQCDSYLCVV